MKPPLTAEPKTTFIGGTVVVLEAKEHHVAQKTAEVSSGETLLIKGPGPRTWAKLTPSLEGVELVKNNLKIKVKL